MRLCFIFAVSLMLPTLSLNAGWHPTEWGMNPTEVAAVMNGKAEISTGGREDQLADSSQTVGNKGISKLGAYSFETTYYYRNGELSSIRLDPVKPYDCAKIKAYMIKKFGKPIIDDRTSDRGTTIYTANAAWENSKQQNEINFVNFSGKCYISFSRIQLAE